MPVRTGVLFRILLTHSVESRVLLFRSHAKSSMSYGKPLLAAPPITPELLMRKLRLRAVFSGPVLPMSIPAPRDYLNPIRGILSPRATDLFTSRMAKLDLTSLATHLQQKTRMKNIRYS